MRSRLLSFIHGAPKIHEDDTHEYVFEHECTTFHNVRMRVGIIACISVAASLYATIKNIWGDDRRLRYPGRLVTFYGAAILLFNLSMAISLPFGFKQLEWGKRSNSIANNEGRDMDSSEAKFWFHACTVQGSLVQFSLSLTAAYSTWLSIAFYIVIRDRFTLNRVIVETRESQKNLRQELAIHAAIISGSAGVSVFAAFNGDIGVNSGLVACWVEGYIHHLDLQFYYFYIWMLLSVCGGLFFSIGATRRLWQVLNSAGSYSARWSPLHRPLRRVVFGQVAWIFTTVFALTLGVVDFAFPPTVATCEAANINIAFFGVYYFVDYIAVPYLLDRVLERRIRGEQSVEGVGQHHQVIFTGVPEEYSQHEGSLSTPDSRSCSQLSSSLGASLITVGLESTASSYELERSGSRASQQASQHQYESVLE